MEDYLVEFYQNNPGAYIMENFYTSADSVQIVESNDKYYMSTSQLERYMESNGILNVEEAYNDIRISNGISENVICVYDECGDFILEQLVESNSIMLEKAVEDDSTNLRRTEKWFNKMIAASKSKADSKEAIDARLAVLEPCLKNMKTQLNTGSVDRNGRIKYSLKSMIPFNSLYRGIKRGEWGSFGKDYAVGAITSLVVQITQNPALNIGSAVSIGVRYATYEKMLQRQIEKTEEAIEFLKKKRKEL